MKKYLIITMLLLTLMCTLCVSANATDISILLNGKAVTFTNDSGYPYIDENNRTMVPLRVTMESAGFVVGYDADAQTAIVITEHNRIEVPIGTNKIYTNNQLTENDTNAVVKNGRTYLPIRVVLEKAGYTVEWANDTKTVNAYTFNFDANEFVPYSTSSLSTLVENILKGNVVYINGGYYATPEYVKLLANVQVHYIGDDLNTAIYPQPSRYDLADIDFDTIYNEQLSNTEWLNDSELAELSDNVFFGFVGVNENGDFQFGFATQGIVSKTLLLLPEYTYETNQKSDFTGTFNGIRIKRENNATYYNHEDLKNAGITK